MKYVLKTKCGEVISSVITEEGVTDATKMLADKKKISVKALLDIYVVDLCSL
jgi:hypothetical protein